MSILILDGRTTAALAVLQSLGRRGHSCVLAARPGPPYPAARSRYVRLLAEYPDPLEDKASFQEWMLALQQERRFALIIPVSESTLIPLHELRAEPLLEGVLAVPPAPAVEIAFDKERSRQLAVSLGVPTPETHHLRDDTDLVRLRERPPRFPVVVKAVRSRAWQGPRGLSMEAGVARTREEMERLLERMLPFAAVQVQKRVPGSGVGVEVLARRGRVLLSFAHRRIHEVPISGGVSSYRQAIAPPRGLDQEAGALIAALAWNGVAMVEFRVDEATGRHWFLEINGRFWGSLPLALFAGADFPAALVDLHLADGDPPPARVRTGVYARNVAKDIQWTKEAIRARRRSAEGLTISLPRALLEWSRVFGGREVWDGASLRDPAPIVAELRECLQREISGVASVAARAWRRWRARTASRARLRKAAYCSRILVLCEGNICRSAFVQARLRAAEGFTSAVRSAGFLSAEGRSSPPDFQKLASTRGVDLSAHRSRRVTQEDLDWAELILIMDAANFESLEGMDRRSVAKTIWLGALDTGDAIEIRDPYGLTAEECDRVLDRLDRCVTAFLDLLDRT